MHHTFDGGVFFALTSHPAYWNGINTNERFQTQRNKHSNFINTVYADGHAKASRPSQIVWGNFYGVMARNESAFGQPCGDPGYPADCLDGEGDYVGPNRFWGRPGAKWSTPVATPAMDAQQTD